MKRILKILIVFIFLIILVVTIIILNNNVTKYRQELRDLPDQEGFPYNVVWPTKDKEEE